MVVNIFKAYVREWPHKTIEIIVSTKLTWSSCIVLFFLNDIWVRNLWFSPTQWLAHLTLSQQQNGGNEEIYRFTQQMCDRMWWSRVFLCFFSQHMSGKPGCFPFPASPKSLGLGWQKMTHWVWKSIIVVDFCPGTWSIEFYDLTSFNYEYLVFSIATVKLPESIQLFDEYLSIFILDCDWGPHMFRT